MQKLSDTRKARENIQQALDLKQSGRPRRGNVKLRDEATHAQGGCNISACIPGTASMAKNGMNRDEKSAFGPQHQLVAFVGQRNDPFSVSYTEGYTCRMLGITEDSHPGSHEAGAQRIRTKLSGETAAVLQPANSVPSTGRSKPPSVKSLQRGDSIPVILVAVRQEGNMEKISAWVTGRLRV